MQNTIEKLNNKRIREYKIILKTRQAKHIEQKIIEIHLFHRKKGKTKNPVIIALYSQGVKPFIKNWIDMDYCPLAILKNNSVIDLHKTKIEKKLFSLLGNIIQANGSMMISYELLSGEHEIHKKTRQMLKKSIPEILTPIGQLLLTAKCYASIKDWYIPEGGREGHKKLQGWKPLNNKIKKQRINTILTQIKEFKKKPESNEYKKTIKKTENTIKKYLKLQSKPN